MARLVHLLHPPIPLVFYFLTRRAQVPHFCHYQLLTLPLALGEKEKA